MSHYANAHLHNTGDAASLMGILMPAKAPATVRPNRSSESATDLEAVRACLDGDDEAYRRLVERHQKRVATIMWRFSRDPDVHDDLVQEAFIEAYESLSRFRARGPFEHWLARIATRTGYRHWRKQQREATIETVPLEEWHQIPDEHIDKMPVEEAAELVHGLLAHLPPRDRLVLALRYIEGLDVATTAERTGWSQTMVNVQAWRARRKLKALLDEAREEMDT